MNDKELVREFLCGSEEAFDQIYQKYSAMLYKSAYLICQNDDDAQDVLQDTFLTFYHKAQEIKKPESLKYWLLRCVSLRSRDLLRKRKAEYPADNILDLAAQKGKGHADVSEEIAFRECIRSLDHKYREVLVLYYYNELSVKEIAAVTGQLTGTVKSRLYYARLKLRETLEGGSQCQRERKLQISR